MLTIHSGLTVRSHYSWGVTLLELYHIFTKLPKMSDFFLALRKQAFLCDIPTKTIRFSQG